MDEEPDPVADWWERVVDTIAKWEGEALGPMPVWAISVPPGTPVWEVNALLRDIEKAGLIIEDGDGWRLAP